MSKPDLEVAKREVLVGERLTLRQLTPEDATERYAKWMNDEQINRYLESRFQTHSTEDLRRFINSMMLSDRDFLFGMFDSELGHIGNIKLGAIDWFHRYGDIGLLIGESDAWSKGYGTEAISLVTKFGLESLSLHKLTAGCYSNNMGSAGAFLKCGWEIEGTRKAHFRSDKEFVDLVQMAIWSPNPESFFVGD